MKKQMLFKRLRILQIQSLISFLCLLSNNAVSQNSYYLTARAFELRNQTDSALKYYAKLLETGKNDSKVFLAIGRIYYSQHKYEEAIKEYTSANKINQDCADFGLAQCYAKKRDLKSALSNLEKHLSSRYKLPQLKVRTDEAFSEFEENPDWKKFWTKDWYDRGDAEIGEARFIYNNKDWMGLINYINGIVKEGSHRHELLYYRACAYYSMGSYQTALKDFNDAINLNKQNYLYFFERSKTLVQLKKEKEALNDLNSAITFSPDVFELYIKRAELNYRLKQYETAKEDIDLYLSLFESDTAALFVSAKILAAKGSYINALSALNKLVKANEQETSYLKLRAEIYEKTNLVAYSIKDYNTVLSLNNSDIFSLKNRGKIYLVQGNKKGACSDLKKAMNLGDFEANNLYLDNCR
jgi:tetratricopeptide (TPR) repeat protein